MHQREYTATKTIYLSDEDFYVRGADICVYTEATSKLAVWRNQEIVGTFNRTPISIQSMVAAGWLTENTGSVAAAPAVEPTPEPVSPHADVTAKVVEPEPEVVNVPVPEDAPLVITSTEPEVEQAVVEPVVEEPAAEEAPEEPKTVTKSKKGGKR